MLAISLPVDGVGWAAQLGTWNAGDWCVLVALGATFVACGLAMQVWWSLPACLRACPPGRPHVALFHTKSFTPQDGIMCNSFHMRLPRSLPITTPTHCPAARDLAAGRAHRRHAGGAAPGLFGCPVQAHSFHHHHPDSTAGAGVSTRACTACALKRCCHSRVCALARLPIGLKTPGGGANSPSLVLDKAATHT